jgi:signal peptidase I
MFYSTLIKIFIIVMILFNFFPFHDIVKTQIQAFKFPSGSMLPALEIGDHILVNKTEKAKDSIKRGDIIESRDKKIFINGSVIQEPYVQHTDSAIRAGKNEPRDNFGPFIMPQNKFFVMGDNREQSYDSRYWGYVPRTDIKGKHLKSIGHGTREMQMLDGIGLGRR